MMNYLHPQAEDIKQGALDILKHSVTAQRLLEELEKNPYQIWILNMCSCGFFVPDKATIYLSLPATQKRQDIEQAMDMSAAFYELRQLRAAYSLPVKNFSADETLRRLYYKNFETVLFSFNVFKELDQAGLQSMENLKKQGLGKLYNSWLNGAKEEELVEMYWSLLKLENDDNSNTK